MALLSCFHSLRNVSQLCRVRLFFPRTSRLVPLILLSVLALSSISRVSCTTSTADEDSSSRASKAAYQDPDRSKYFSNSTGDDDASRVCRELVEPNGFTCEDHRVVTRDGFVLGLQRVTSRQLDASGAVFDVNKTSGGNGRVVSRGPVLIQHGLFLGAESWVVGPPGISLPFLLARLGFEVWLGNSRCGPWSYGHTRWQPKDKEYWEWTWADMARHDLPAQIDYILAASHTGARQVFYVGHSQGTLTFLSALTAGYLPPATVAAAFLLAPVTSLAHLSSPIAHEAAKLDLDRLVRATRLHEFSLRNALGELVVATACASPRINCSSLLSAFTGPNCCIDIRHFAKLVPWFPLASSVKNMAHFGQMVRSGEWKQFDYGFIKNWLRYCQSTPPFFRASDLPSTTRLAIAYGGRDSLAVPADVEWLISKLARRPEVLYMPAYAHLDFLFATPVVTDVYTQIVRFFTEYQLDRAYE
ncbi:unnamed protein product [Closterium sp. Yama58-4]|nr:unnamed protein product [Closterium sp. Yama58-4]